MREMDLTGVPCPMNWVRVRLALEAIEDGEPLELVLDPGEPMRSVPRSAREDGHDVTVTGNRVTIVKR